MNAKASIVNKIYLVKKSEAQLNIHTYKSVSARISYAYCQNVLVCARAENFGMRSHRSFLYAQAQIILVSASAGYFGMRRLRSFWYAQAQINLVCAGAGHFGMRRRRLLWYAEAQVNFSCAGAGLIFMHTRSFFSVFLPYYSSFILNTF